MTDIHFEGSDEIDSKNIAIMNKLLNYTNPDFVALTGDNVWLDKCTWNNQTARPDAKKCWSKLAETLEKNKAKYALALGNHDCEGREAQFRYDLLKWDMQFNYSQTNLNDKKVTAGSTQIVPIYSSFNKTSLWKPALILYFFDTKDHGCGEYYNSYGCVEHDQLEWFIEKDKFLRKLQGDSYASIAFAHIPPPEFVDLYNKGKVYGNRYEIVACPAKNTGWVDALISRNVSALFVGHDHDNDFGGNYKGIELVFGRKTGYGAQGPDYFDRGGRVIEFEEQEEENKTKIKQKHQVVEESGKIVENGPATKRNDTIEDCPKYSRILKGMLYFAGFFQIILFFF